MVGLKGQIAGSLAVNSHEAEQCILELNVAFSGTRLVSPAISCVCGVRADGAGCLIGFLSSGRVYWDLDIQTNAVIKQRAPLEMLTPHPEVELLRSQLMLKLRQHYRELCQQREGNVSPSP